MDIVWTILIGFAIGLVARMIKPGRDSMGFIFTTLLGIGGAMVAKLAAQHLGWTTHTQLGGFVAAVIGAVVLLVVFNALRR